MFTEGDKVRGTFKGKPFRGVVEKTRFARQGREVIMVYVATEAGSDVPGFAYVKGDAWVQIELDKSTDDR